MLDIVVYTDNMSFMTKNISSINIALSNYNVDYRIYKFVTYNDEFDSLVKNRDKKIYVIDNDVNKVSGFEVANRIREYDWDSIIIMGVASYFDGSRLMILDYVFKDKMYEKRLIEDVKMAVSIIDKYKVFIFKYNRVIYRIPYDKICYIEKESNIKRCIIHTLGDQYYITASIDYILSQLNADFCRTHQSCIVNLCNVKEIDLKTNMIIFNNGDRTDMLNMKMKREVKKYLGIS